MRIRADVLVRVAGNIFDLVEVKSTTSTKPAHEHEWDLAVQLAVIEGCGVRDTSRGSITRGRSLAAIR